MPICGRKESLPFEIKSLVTLLEVAVLSHPYKVALIDAETDNTITFLQLSERSNQFARILLKELLASLKKRCNENPDGDNIVMICVPPSIDLIVILFAILKIKCAYLPIDVDSSHSRVNHIINDAKPLLLITKDSPSATSNFRSDDGPVKVLQLENISKQVEMEDCGTLTDEESARLSTDELLTAILYTSGSSGIPKGVRLSQRATLNRLIWQWRHFPFKGDEVGCFKTVLTFVDSISEIFGPLLTGRSLVIIPKVMISTDFARFIDALEKNKVGRIVLVPSLLRSVLLFYSGIKEPPLECVRLWVCSGEVLPADLLKSFFKVFSNGQSICNFYGSTEVLGDVTFVEFRNLKDVEEKLFENKVPIGIPVSNCKIYLMDSNLEREVEEGIIGEIMVAGESLASGFVGNSKAENFIQNPLSFPECNLLFRTGDFGKYFNGQLHYAGRKDSQMKVRGHRIDLNEVDMALRRVEGVKECQVLCHKPGEVDQILCGFFTSNTLGAEHLRTELSSLLPRYMMPQCIKIDEFPLLANGKVDRQNLLKTFETKASDMFNNIEFNVSSCEESKKELAIILLKVVAKILGPSSPPVLSLDQNFFEIGGNSLNSILTITSLLDIGYQIGITDFLKADNFVNVLMRLTRVEHEECKFKIQDNNENTKYKILPLTESMRDDVCRITSQNLIEKENLCSSQGLTCEELMSYLQPTFPNLLKEGLSFVVCLENTGKIVAASLNHDFHNRGVVPEVDSDGLRNVFAIMDYLEDAASEQLPEGLGQVFHNFLLVTLNDDSSDEMVLRVKLMEQHAIKLAKQKGFKALATTNTSVLTQHLCEDLFSYKVIKTIQANQFVKEDGSKPFEHAPDQLIVTTCALKFTD